MKKLSLFTFHFLIFTAVSWSQTTQWRLIWDKNTEADMEYYAIYRKDRSPADSLIANVDHIPRSGSDTTMFYIDSDLDKGIEYFYRLKAVDSSGLSSEFSAEVSAAIPRIENIESTIIRKAGEFNLFQLDSSKVVDPDHNFRQIKWEVINPPTYQVTIDSSTYPYNININQLPILGDSIVVSFRAVDRDSFFDMKAVTIKLVENNPPKFTTNALPVARAGRPYSFQLVATDPDADNLIFNKISGPAWLVISTTGAVTGTPPISDAGNFPISIQVSDGELSDSLVTTITINPNGKPEFLTNNIDTAYVSSNYHFVLEATDPEDDSLTFEKLTGPSWMNVSTAGTVSGTPTISDTGTINVSFKVTDGFDSDTLQTKIIIVNETPRNRAPYFVSTSYDTAFVDSVYSMQLEAEDPDNDDLSFYKISGPAWCTVSLAGLLSGMPGLGNAGSSQLIIRVNDGYLSDTLTAAIVVEVEEELNQAPVFVTDELPNATVGFDYEFQLEAADPNNDDIFYDLFNGPLWMTVSESGLVTGSPGSDDVRTSDVSFIVSDSKLTDTLFTSIVVENINSNATEVTAYPIPYRPGADDNYSINFTNLPLNGELIIYDLLGNPLFRYDNISDTYSWPVKNQAGKEVRSGVYLYVVNDSKGKKRHSGKLIIVR